MAAQARDKVLKESFIRFRQNTLGLQKWKPRHLVFKVTHGGRLQLIVYKDHTASAAGEIKEIAIEDFGGLEHNLKLDNEKYAFAIITTNVTECFSVDSPRELLEWKQILQEYLGKELLIDINIPVKHHQLKAGKAVLRIRNTSFTITTCDNPPRCQGTWNIIHIRKYGGTGLFRFQTGSKCPTGEFLYSFESADNSKLKKVFNNLSNHKPIFADDRLGRRMTLERAIQSKVKRDTSLSSNQTGPSRLSIQSANSGFDQHVYENKEFAQRVPPSPDQSLLYSNIRRTSFEDGVFTAPKLESVAGGRQASPTKRVSNGEDGLYQNFYSGSRTSPTKKAMISVPVPEGYYNLTPPPLIRHHQSLGESSEAEVSQRLSKGSLRSEKTSNSSLEQHDFCASVIGEKRLQPPAEPLEAVGGTYQNVELLKGSADQRNGTETEEPGPLPVSVSEEAWSPHNYTNVELAHANVQGHSSVTRKDKKIQDSLLHARRLPDPEPECKINLPTKSDSQTTSASSTPHQSLVISSSSDDLLSPSPASVTSTHVLRNSLSNIELNTSSKDNKLPDYYNYCAPSLPAHSSSQNKTLSLKSKLTLSGHRSVHSGSTSPENEPLEEQNQRGASGHSISDDHMHHTVETNLVALNNNLRDVNFDTEVKRLSSSCDCLDMHSPSDANLLDDRPGSQNAMYDKLAPYREAQAENGSLYDTLERKHSASSSPEPSSDSTLKNHQYPRLEHKYEYIDVELRRKEADRSASNSPMGMEHPFHWTNSLPIAFHHSKSSFDSKRRSARLSLKEMPNSQSRKKHLPLQTEEVKIVGSPECNTVRPPRLSREESLDTDKLVQRPRISVDSTTSVSKRESVLSNASTSSGEVDIKYDFIKQNHTDHRVTHEDVAIKFKALHGFNNETPPLPKKGLPARSDSTDGVPVIPPRPHESKFTVALPDVQCEIETLPPVPRPKVLSPPDTSYTALSFSNGENQTYSQVDPVMKSQRTLRIATTSDDSVPYVAVDFEMTAGLQRTSEQVKDHHREFFETKQT